MQFKHFLESDLDHIKLLFGKQLNHKSNSDFPITVIKQQRMVSRLFSSA
jgi:hypothetical protein